MSLTEKQSELVQQYAEEKVKKCHNCGKTMLGVGDVIPASTHIPGAARLHGKNVTMVQIVCLDCGYIHLFSTLCVGLQGV